MSLRTRRARTRSVTAVAAILVATALSVVAADPAAAGSRTVKDAGDAPAAVDIRKVRFSYSEKWVTARVWQAPDGRRATTSLVIDPGAQGRGGYFALWEVAGLTMLQYAPSTDAAAEGFGCDEAAITVRRTRTARITTFRAGVACLREKESVGRRVHVNANAYDDHAYDSAVGGGREDWRSTVGVRRG